jgi:hypothetical protein
MNIAYVALINKVNVCLCLVNSEKKQQLSFWPIQIRKAQFGLFNLEKGTF